MKTTSAGLLLYRVRDGAVQVFLVHPGGPYWARKDLGAWTIPKGESAPGEDLLATARREFEEETGCAPAGAFIPLGAVDQPGGKRVHAWAVDGDCEPGALRSNTFSVEWPPGSGRQREFPEVDRGAWFTVPEARRRILKGQLPLLDEFERVVSRERYRVRARDLQSHAHGAGRHDRGSGRSLSGQRAEQPQ
jgi:predicted NUDIX family NTP pyrophosphohydrolase